MNTRFILKNEKQNLWQENVRKQKELLINYFMNEDGSSMCQCVCINRFFIALRTYLHTHMIYWNSEIVLRQFSWTGNAYLQALKDHDFPQMLSYLWIIMASWERWGSSFTFSSLWPWIQVCPSPWLAVSQGWSVLFSLLFNP